LTIACTSRSRQKSVSSPSKPSIGRCEGAQASVSISIRSSALNSRFLDVHPTATTTSSNSARPGR
jgi:hypothetical protein